MQEEFWREGDDDAWHIGCAAPHWDSKAAAYAMCGKEAVDTPQRRIMASGEFPEGPQCEGCKRLA